MKPSERPPRMLRTGPLLAALGASLTLVTPGTSAAEYADPLIEFAQPVEFHDPAEFEGLSFAPVAPAWTDRLAPEPPPKRRSPLWLTDTLRIRKSVGLEHRSYHRWNGRPIILRVMGPKIRKKRRLGVVFYIHF